MEKHLKQRFKDQNEQQGLEWEVCIWEHVVRVEQERVLMNTVV